MNQAQRLWTRSVGARVPDSAGGKHDGRDWQERDEHRNANELVAASLGRRLIGRNLTRRQLRLAAPIVHYSFGAAVGALYGAYRDRFGARYRASGIGLGAALWATADELAMPILGLSIPTSRRSGEKHLQSFLAHLVYGVATERARRHARAAL